jgi:fatty acid desaturase
LEKPVEFPDQFQFSPYQHHHRSSLQIPTSTIAFALPQRKFFLAFRTLADFAFPEAVFAFRIRRSFPVAVGIFCAQFFLVCFFGLVVWLFVVCCLHVFAEDAAPAAARLRARDLLIQ